VVWQLGVYWLMNVGSGSNPSTASVGIANTRGVLLKIAISRVAEGFIIQVVVSGVIDTDTSIQWNPTENWQFSSPADLVCL